jgi:hypothetical protein
VKDGENDGGHEVYLGLGQDVEKGNMGVPERDGS